MTTRVQLCILATLMLVAAMLTVAPPAAAQPCLIPGYPATAECDHLKSYTVKDAGGRINQEVFLENQISINEVCVVRGANELMIPTAKRCVGASCGDANQTGGGNPPAAEPFLCYNLRQCTGTQAGTILQASDQFSQPIFTNRTIRITGVAHLCTPAALTAVP
jgi:hypothetical protein